MLSVKAFCLDYFLSEPLDGVDTSYSMLRGTYAKRLPIIRIYGTDLAGQKICINVHGVLPYFFIHVLKKDFESEDPLRHLCHSLENSLKQAGKVQNSLDLVVFHAKFVYGRSIYGYRTTNSLFIKIYVTDPSLIPCCAELFQNGSVTGQPVQTLETHIPFLLKFFIDYNLFGMNYICADSFLVRGKFLTGEVHLDDAVYPNVLSNHRFPSQHQVPKLTSVNLEVDISAQDITNHRCLQENASFNPGLEALWDEERMRRQKATTSTPVSLPAPNEFLPLARDGIFHLSEKEHNLLEEWDSLLKQSSPNLVVANSNTTTKMETQEFVTQWLEQSQSPNDTDDSEPMVGEAGDAVGGAQKRETPSAALFVYPASPDTSSESSPVGHQIDSSQLLEQLARASEDADASLPDVAGQISAVRLLSKASSLSAGQTSNPASSSLSSVLAASQKDSDVGASQAAGEDTGSALSLCLLTGLLTLSRDRARRASGLREDGGVGLIDLDAEDEIQMSQLSAGDVTLRADELDPCRQPFQDSLQLFSDDEEEYDNGDAVTTTPLLSPILTDSPSSEEEGGATSPLVADPRGDPQMCSTLLWSPMPEIDFIDDNSTGDRGMRSEVSAQQLEPFCTQASLGLSSSGNSAGRSAVGGRYIPQLDGNNDNRSDQSSSAGQVPTHRSFPRRRLGLRLKSRGHTATSTASQCRERSSSHDKSSASSFKASRTVTGAIGSQSPQTVPHRRRLSLRRSFIQIPEERVVATNDLLVDTQLHQEPVVLLERCDHLVSQLERQPTTRARDHHHQPGPETSRFSPKDEFADLTSTPMRHRDTAETMPTLGELSLFSDTACVSPTTTRRALPSSDIPVPVSELPGWRLCGRRPPTLEQVALWLKERPTQSSPQRSDSPGQSSPAHELSPEPDLSASQRSTDASSSLTHNRTENSGGVSEDNTFRTSLSHSMSMLYQAASQRCFLPVQVDHTTVASLELYARSRLISSAGLRDSKELQRSRPGGAKVTLRGLIPDPVLDPIGFVCLSVSAPPVVNALARNTPLSDSNRTRTTFVVVNSNQLPGARDCSPAPADNKYLRLRSWKRSFASSPLPKGREKVKFIWCPNEWDLLSWIVYIVQCYDPEVMLGFDVERQSWGYLVERASHIGRSNYCRELSRLAPDILACAQCRRRISEVVRLATAGPGRVPNHLEATSLPHGLPTSSVGTCSGTCASAPEANRWPSGGYCQTRVSNRVPGWPSGPGAGRTGATFPCPGRVLLSLWRVAMTEVSLFEYSLETVYHHLLGRYVPRFTHGQLTQWFEEEPSRNRWRVVDYWRFRSMANLRIVEALDLIGRTSEFARVFGIEFYHVLSRGSQYRVESLLCRIAHRSNLLLASPTAIQRARQRAPETIPLNLEPMSRLFVDGPVAVLDFQSLYPSIIIAYNYCFSTVIGRLDAVKSSGEEKEFQLGCLTQYLPAGSLQEIGTNVNISPNGVVFVKSDIRQGILPSMLTQLLQTRLMVKESMKLHGNDKSLHRLLDARQLGLKLLANVTFGYTAAGFSGRMPCVDIGDSIVAKARETLEQAIQLVESTDWLVGDRRTRQPPRVVYGDTDSLFVHLPGWTKAEAFKVARAMADAVTAANPAPVKLKLEKIYYPCLLEAKKRYVGYAYESADQSKPVFDAKGIETVRRDSAPFVGKLLRKTLCQLFDHFPPPATEGADYSASVVQQLALAETVLRASVRQFAIRLVAGRVPFADCLISRPYWGQTAYRPGAFAPALQIARRQLSLDPRGEPLVGERVAFSVSPGRPGQPLLACLRSLAELRVPVAVASFESGAGRRLLSPRLNSAYYLDKQLLPAFSRVTELVGWNVSTWLSDIARWQPANQTSLAPQHRLPPGPPSPASQSSLHCLDQSAGCSWLSAAKGTTEPVVRQAALRRGRPRQRWLGDSQRQRSSAVMRAFLRRLPVLVCNGCDRRLPQGPTGQTVDCCPECLARNPTLATVSHVSRGLELHHLFSETADVERLCTGCLAHRGGGCDAIWLCVNFTCPIHSRRLAATSQSASQWAARGCPRPTAALASLTSW